MIELKRILVPTDFSEFSSAAIDYACTLADKFDAELHLLHVLEAHLGSTPVFAGGLALSPRVGESAQAAMRALQEIVPDRPAIRATISGPPFLGIIHYAKEHDVDLIVMGTHGRTGLDHVMLGSVAERVVRKASCPVMTVRHPKHRFVSPLDELPTGVLLENPADE